MKNPSVIASFTALAAFCACCQMASAASISPTTNAVTYSATSLYNAGNSAARAGNPAQAILDYERALILAPADADIRANLHAVRESVGLSAHDDSWLTRYVRLAAPNTMYWLGMFGIVLAGASFLVWRSRGSKRLPLAAGVFLGTVLAGLSIGDALATLPTLNEAVVMQASPASVAPIGGAEAEFTVPAADLVRIRDQHEGYFLIRDSQGRDGWVAKSNLSLVIPARTSRGS